MARGSKCELPIYIELETTEFKAADEGTSITWKPGGRKLGQMARRGRAWGHIS